nr:MAG TPA: hypothetical protein [Caudoviricetes sp.]
MYANNLDDAFSAFTLGETEEWVKSDKYMDYPEYQDEEYTYIEGRTIGDITAQISVQGESYSQYISFVMDRYYDGIDLTGMSIWIHYELKDGSGSEDSPVNVEYNNNAIRFGWIIPEKATQQSGDIKIGVWVNGTAPNTKPYILKTKEKIYTIHQGLIPGSGITQPDQNWFENFVVQIDSKVSTAQGYANDAQASKTAAAGSAAESAQSAAESAQALEDNRAYVESQKETFVGYNKRETDLKYANALIGTASGMGRVTVGDAWEAPVTDLEVSGRSEQMVTTGAQLLDCSKLNKSAGGAVVNYGDGGYSISGTGALTASFTASYTLDIKNVLKPGNLILKSQPTMPKLYIRIWDGSNVLVEMQGNSTKQITQDMIDNENVRVECFFHGNAGSTITPGTYHPMLYQSGDGTWEPYTGGKPSPSPEYPQPIISTGTVTTGAQLFDASKIPTKSAGGATVTNNGDGSFIVDGSGNLTGEYFCQYNYSREETLKLVKPGKYSMTFSSVYPLVNYIVQGTGVSKAIRNSTGAAVEITEADLAVEDVTLSISIYGGAGRTITPGIIKPMVWAKETLPRDSDWEPYTGGKPSPSPDYPQTMDVTVTGAQLLDASKIPDRSSGGITVTNTSAGSIISGDGPITTKFDLRTILTHEETMGLLGNERTFTLSSDTVVYPYFFFGFYDKNGGVMNLQLSGMTQVTKTLPDVADIDTLYVQYGYFGDKDVSIVAGEQKVMLNTGTTALPWQPYQSSTAAITLTEPLRGIGDVRDRIMCRDGVWGIERKIVPLILNGSEAWHQFNTSGSKSFGAADFDSRIKIDSALLCDRLSEDVTNNVWIGKRDNTISTSGSSTRYIRIFLNSTATLDTLKALLSAEPMHVIAERKSPAWEPLPADTQSALSALTTYTGTTHVTITAGGPEPDVGLGYVQDTNVVIAELKKLIEGMQNVKS